MMSEELIIRASMALMVGASERDVIYNLIKDGASTQDAYLAVKAGGTYNRLEGLVEEPDTLREIIIMESK